MVVRFAEYSRMKKAAALTVLVIVVVMLLLLVMQQDRSNILFRVTAHGRRYSISNDMNYTYGVGENFSIYDRQLIEYVRSHISQPSLTRPRQLASPNRHDKSQFGQSKFVDKLLSRRRHGFFVECGAYDGETHSNSLFFELRRNWTGILIEANPYLHSRLLKKNRRAYVLRACLSAERRPVTVGMKPVGEYGGISDKMHKSQLRRIRASRIPDISVNCFPLNTIMATINVTYIDYFSLDVEGSELYILRTIDWTRLRIDVITIEYVISTGHGIDRTATRKKLKNLRQFFNDTGIYKEVGRLGGLDVVFSRI